MTEVETLHEQLRQMQKLSSLGMLSAGIAHEIQNPLNFVINFSKMSEKLLSDIKEIVDDIRDDINEDDADELQDIADDLTLNMQKIKEHGERAISIIQGILLISRGKEGERLPTDVCNMVHEYVWLAYHAQRAKDKTFNIFINETYPREMQKMMVIPQDLSRAVLNVVNNACYAVTERARNEAETGNNDYKPTISVEVEDNNTEYSIIIKDNGIGIPDDVKEKLFHEIITTKPVGHGTGLGMQITHDIIEKEHNGKILIDTKVGEGTTFTFVLPNVKESLVK